MYKLISFKNEWVLIIKGDYIKMVLKDQPVKPWLVGEEYVIDSRDTIIAESISFKKIKELGMLHVL